jgi:indolepyruvate ferredoxin oxidoreductase alpha subunit
MKQLLTGNEAIARGAWEGGVHFASAYPGTPSTEILENLAGYGDIDAEWAPNEKTALEAAIGAAVAGGRSISAMKHVGVNVAADPLFTFSYTGTNGGIVLVSADEPGQHSSQNEQDNRNYAKFAKIPMLEPSDSQECKDMVMQALEISETFDCPVLLRTTTRINHSKSAVECGERKERPIKTYIKDIRKYITVPAFAREMRKKVEERTEKLLEFSETTSLNRIENGGKKIGIIVSGMCYNYAREVFGDTVSYLKLGFTWPLPSRLIRSFCQSLETIYVIEENDAYIEEAVAMLGFSCKGKNSLPHFGELTPDVIRTAILGQARDAIAFDTSLVIPRPPTLCAGCPHRGFFYETGLRKDIVVFGDIGCYTLGFSEPYNAMDFNFCMGASFSAGHGAQKIFNRITGNDKRVVAVLGDSTFFHTGMNSLLEVVYNNSNTVCVILDNAITGMTGHQNNPGNGLNARGEIANRTSIEEVVKALGVKNIAVINPNDITEVKKTLDWALAFNEPSVIITRWPCALKRITAAEKKEYQNPFATTCLVDEAKCVGCKICIRSGCPAISFCAQTKKAGIDPAQCVGCTVCKQLCPKEAIAVKEGA